MAGARFIAAIALIGAACGSCIFGGNELKQEAAGLLAPELPPGARALRIEVHPDSLATVQGVQVPLNSLEQHLVLVSQTIGVADIHVIVSATEDTPFGDVSHAIEAARNAGYNDVSIAPRPIQR